MLVWLSLDVDIELRHTFWVDRSGPMRSMLRVVCQTCCAACPSGIQQWTHASCPHAASQKTWYE
jgi:hypothetical protein